MHDTSKSRQVAAHASVHDRICVDPSLNRKLVSYQGNKAVPGFRWMKYKEGFSADLVERLLKVAGAKAVLDPFSGIGTAPLTASRMGIESVGIEMMPVGNMAARCMVAVARSISSKRLLASLHDMVQYVEQGNAGTPFSHVRITERAFPAETETALARARYFLDTMVDSDMRLVLDFCVMSVLEEISYTRKDGQFLRWDRRSGRDVADKLHKGRIPALAEALTSRVGQIVQDVPHMRRSYGGPRPRIITDSCLAALHAMADDSFDCVVTSPPYANRYDYTRTYALELAWLGHTQAGFGALRQKMLSATVENRPKSNALDEIYGDSKLLSDSRRMAAANGILADTLDFLRGNCALLNNPHVIRLVENYFVEMAVVIRQLGRLVRLGGHVFMVNDNVRYGGREVPVDIILSEFAESSGFRCESIRTLSRGKGNSSQQMGRFGRQEIRKCVYHWTKS